LSTIQWEERILKRGLPHLNDWIAERQSSCSASSDSLLEWFPRVENSHQAAVVILLSSYLQPWQTDRIIEHIAQLAYRYKYQGEWVRIQELLESEHTPEGILSKYSQHRHVDEIFGNFLPACNRYIKWFNRAFRVPTRRPVRRKVRKRGYDDKGTLRPNHQKGRNLPDPSPPPEDRRHLIRHPLSKFSEGVRWQNPSSDLEGGGSL